MGKSEGNVCSNIKSDPFTPATAVGVRISNRFPGPKNLVANALAFPRNKLNTELLLASAGLNMVSVILRVVSSPRFKVLLSLKRIRALDKASVFMRSF